MIEIISVCENPFMENTYIISDPSGIYIVDPGSPTESINTAIAKCRLPDGNLKDLDPATGSVYPALVKNVFLTHGHYDHILSLRHFDPGIVWAHEREKPVLEDPKKNVSELMNMPMSVKGINYIKGDKQEVSGFEFIHVPGHTAGCVLIKKGNVMFTGDTLFYDTVGRTDLPTGSGKELQKSLTLFGGFDKKVMCYPGHGAPFRLADAYETNYFLRK